MNPELSMWDLHRLTADLASEQDGLFTREQIRQRGEVSDSAFATLHEHGIVDVIRPGVFRHRAGPNSPQLEARAAWLQTDPRRTSLQRKRTALARRAATDVIGGSAAARHWDIDWFVMDDIIWTPDDTDLQEPDDFVTFRRRRVDPSDVRWSHHHFPFTSVERTLADAFRLEGDIGHLASALNDALWSRYAPNLVRLQTLLDHVGSSQRIPSLFTLVLEQAGGLPRQPGRQYGDKRWRDS